MTFDDILEQALGMLRRRGRVSYRALKCQFDLDDAYLTDLKDEILYAQSDAVEDVERGLIWNGNPPERNLDAQSETDKEIVNRAGNAAQLGLAVRPPMTRHVTGLKLVYDGQDTRVSQDYTGHQNIQHTVAYTTLETT